MEEIKPYRRKIKWNTGTSYGLEYGFSYLSLKAEQVRSFSSCRDRLGDLMFMERAGASYDAQGDDFKCIGRACTRQLRLLFGHVPRISTKPLDPKILVIQGLLHQAERDLGIRRKTIVRKVQNPPAQYKNPGVFAFFADADWILSPVMLSLYTMIIREGTFATDKDTWREMLRGVAKGEKESGYYADRQILEVAMPGIDRIVEKGFRNVFGEDPLKNYPRQVHTNYLATHCYFGIQAFAKGASKPFCPHWYED